MNANYGVVAAPGTVRFERLLPRPIESVWSFPIESDKRACRLGAGQIEAHVGGRVELAGRA